MRRVFALLGLMVLLAGCGGGMEGTALLPTSADSTQVGSDFEMPPPPPVIDGDGDFELPPGPPTDALAGSESDLPPGPPGL